MPTEVLAGLVERVTFHNEENVARRDRPRIGQYRRDRALARQIERRTFRYRDTTQRGFPAVVLTVRAD
jgi:hypothetical protein